LSLRPNSCCYSSESLKAALGYIVKFYLFRADAFGITKALPSLLVVRFVKKSENVPARTHPAARKHSHQQLALQARSKMNGDRHRCTIAGRSLSATHAFQN